jgi:hypothetical protein
MSSPRTKEFRHEEEMETSGDTQVSTEEEVTEKPRSLIHYDFLSKYYFWIFLSIALVFGLIVFMMYMNNRAALAATGSLLFLNNNILGILLLIALVVVAYAGFQANMYAMNSGIKILSNSLFVGFLVIFLLWGYFVFMTNQLQYAFWTSIVLLIVSVLWLFFLWKVDRLSAYFMIYVVLLLIYLAYYTNQLQKRVV